MTENNISRIPCFATRSVWFWLVFAMFTFMIMDQFSLSLGDDFAYYFTDSRTHAYDGKRVETLKDCITTQFNHYTTTNGRFIVHLVDMIILNFVPAPLYRIFNSFMFGLLYLGLLTLGFRRPRIACFASILLAMIWWIIPDSGTVMLSLISYSVNYLWSGVAIIYLLILWKNIASLTSKGFALLCVYTFVCGTLQESFSIPICFALIIDSVFRFKKLTRRERMIILLFILGSAILICAPGNLAHFASGGAARGASLLHKFTTMLRCFLFSPMSILMVLLLVKAINSKNGYKCFLNENRLLLYATAGAILFGSVTFTAPRQFFAPSLFSIVILCRFIDTKRRFLQAKSITINLSILILLVTFFSIATFLRKSVKENHSRYIEHISRSSSGLTVSDVSCSPYNVHPCLWKIFGDYAPDPWEGKHFSFPYDSYSRRGLSRIIFDSPDSIEAVIPYPVEYIIQKCSPTIASSSDSIYATRSLDDVYNAVTIHGPKPVKIKSGSSPGIRLEQFYTKDSIQIVITPSFVKNITIIYR